MRMGRRDSVDNLIIALLTIVLFIVGYLYLTMISKLEHIQDLIELYGEKGWEYIIEENARRYFREREEEQNGGLQ